MIGEQLVKYADRCDLLTRKYVIQFCLAWSIAKFSFFGCSVYGTFSQCYTLSSKTHVILNGECIVNVYIWRDSW